jgi:hypothetical protein
MSRVYLLRITQKINIFQLYEKFKKKNQENRRKIRLVLCITRTQNSQLQKDIWKIILDYIPNATKDSFGQLIDIPPYNFSIDEFIDLFNNTLMNENILQRNPLFYSLENDPEESLKSGKIIQYSKARYILYPSLYAYSSPFPSKTESKILTRNNIFIGLMEKQAHRFGVRINDPLPQIDGLIINGTTITQMRRVAMYADTSCNKPLYFLYFPEIGPLHCESIKFESKNNCVVSFDVAFCACSSSLRTFFKNKHYKN